MLGEIYWYEFSREEFTNGIRPCLIVSAKVGDYVMICPITYDKLVEARGVTVKLDTSTGLEKDSIVLLKEIISINIKDLGRRIGKIGNTAQFQVTTILGNLLTVYNGKNKINKDVRYAVRKIKELESIFELIDSGVLLIGDSVEVDSMRIKLEKRHASLQYICDKTNLDYREALKGRYRIITT